MRREEGGNASWPLRVGRPAEEGLVRSGCGLLFLKENNSHLAPFLGNRTTTSMKEWDPPSICAPLPTWSHVVTPGQEALSRAGRRWLAPFPIPSCHFLVFFSTGHIHLAPGGLSTHHKRLGQPPPLWLTLPARRCKALPRSAVFGAGLSDHLPRAGQAARGTTQARHTEGGTFQSLEGPTPSPTHSTSGVQV